MKKISIYFCFVFLASVACVACMDEREIIYAGPTVVEFKNHLLGRNTTYTPVGVFPSGTGTAQTLTSRYISVDNRGTDSILVQLVGPQLSRDIDIEYTIDESSTAIEGTHYDFVNAGTRTIVLPAGTSSTYILINPTPGSLDAGETRSLTLRLLGHNEVGVSENYSTFTTYLRP
ncbi:hypothetical protein SAMN05660226_03948 [Parapedobacter luteus]|uniref:DUF4843 domain-containing protein n=1 Tax=Parapedobacter luteus TaxID=623280 RepID=A0A1T5FES3_9SPHI|nr:hypothetical protein [Parapedobacter luteus]SKB94617.1 hypothetical protein SAMN05660226_03948 [Parapedobacter luteus]